MQDMWGNLNGNDEGGGSRELMNVSLPNAQTATHKINDRPKDKNTVGMG